MKAKYLLFFKDIKISIVLLAIALVSAAVATILYSSKAVHESEFAAYLFIALLMMIGLFLAIAAFLQIYSMFIIIKLKRIEVVKKKESLAKELMNKVIRAKKAKESKAEPEVINLDDDEEKE